MPLNVRIADRCWDAMLGTAEHGTGVGVRSGGRRPRTGGRYLGRLRNVINLPQIEDETFRASKQAESGRSCAGAIGGGGGAGAPRDLLGPDRVGA